MPDAFYQQILRARQRSSQTPRTRKEIGMDLTINQGVLHLFRFVQLIYVCERPVATEEDTTPPTTLVHAWRIYRA